MHVLALATARAGLAALADRALDGVHPPGEMPFLQHGRVLVDATRRRRKPPSG
jgi:hypothetical protein